MESLWLREARALLPWQQHLSDPIKPQLHQDAWKAVWDGHAQHTGTPNMATVVTEGGLCTDTQEGVSPRNLNASF